MTLDGKVNSIASRRHIFEMACKGICTKYLAAKHGTQGFYAQSQDHKRCATCEVFIKWAGIRCPCCSIVLRTKPRYFKTKEQREKMWRILSLRRKPSAPATLYPVTHIPLIGFADVTLRL